MLDKLAAYNSRVQYNEEDPTDVIVKCAFMRGETTNNIPFVAVNATLCEISSFRIISYENSFPQSIRHRALLYCPWLYLYTYDFLITFMISYVQFDSVHFLSCTISKNSYANAKLVDN